MCDLSIIICICVLFIVYFLIRYNKYIKVIWLGILIEFKRVGWFLDYIDIYER